MRQPLIGAGCIIFLGCLSIRTWLCTCIYPFTFNFISPE